MDSQKNYVVLLLGLISLLHRTVILAVSATPGGGGGGANYKCSAADFNRKIFPAGFAFGTASSSYQYEGGASEGGRTPSIWDTFTHKYPGKIVDGSNGDIAIDSYHRYKDDVRIMKDMNVNAYRFSISWTRILPNGRPSGGIKKEGINYYNNLINELISNGIRPYVTLFHFDLPQILEDEYGGFLSPRIVEDFKNYAEVCFREFGDRVKHWMTLNEPWTYSFGGYVLGFLAPGRCSGWQGLNCTGGDSATEPYLVTHHQLLAHGAAAQLYKQKYQKSQKGKIRIVLVASWMVPFSNAKHDKVAALRELDFMFGWFMDPLTKGDYPHIMRSLVAQRLPKFTQEQSDMIKGSLDFIGLNYYTSNYAADTRPNATRPSFATDSRVVKSSERNGKLIGRKASSWLYVYPQGLYDLLLYIKTKYNNPLIYITENGITEENNDKSTLEEALNDDSRIDYHCQHLSKLNNVIKDGANVDGYFAWTLFDDFEWNSGYTSRFGINYVDFKNGLKRHPKKSALWFKNFLKK